MKWIHQWFKQAWIGDWAFYLLRIHWFRHINHWCDQHNGLEIRIGFISMGMDGSHHWCIFELATKFGTISDPCSMTFSHGWQISGQLFGWPWKIGRTTRTAGKETA